MYTLRRSFHEGADRPDLVLIHYTAAAEGHPEVVLARATEVVAPSGAPGVREVQLMLPRPAEERPLRVRYFFSTVAGGREWFSPAYEVVLPDGSAGGDAGEIAEEGGGNAPPAGGWGTFRLALPLRPDEPRTGIVRFGFGAMRKKPSVSLCRAGVAIVDGNPPVVEIPRALSVLKDRPMPYFLYHVPDGGAAPIADKINCARITVRDEEGDIVCARMVWGEPSWAASNITEMELRKFGSGDARAVDYFHAADRDAYLRARIAALAAHPLPRTFEGFVYGPSGSVVEYCFQALRVRNGEPVVAWINPPSGGNWTIRL